MSAVYRDDSPPMPRTRGERANGPRPCVHYRCRHHLGLDVAPSGRVQVFLDPDELHLAEHTCALDAADEGPRTQAEVGRLIGRRRTYGERAGPLSRETVRLIELEALRRLAPWLVGLEEEEP